MFTKPFSETVKKIPLFGFYFEYVYRKITKRKTVAFAIRENIHKVPRNAMVVQIGSNDGLANDPLRNLILEQKRWTCLFVEPVPYIFDKLRKNYGDDSRFIYVNTAINSGETSIFWYVDKQAKIDLPTHPAYGLLPKK